MEGERIIIIIVLPVGSRFPSNWRERGYPFSPQFSVFQSLTSCEYLIMISFQQRPIPTSHATHTAKASQGHVDAMVNVTKNSDIHPVACKGHLLTDLAQQF